MSSWRDEKLALPTIVVGSVAIVLIISAITIMILFCTSDSCSPAPPPVVCPPAANTGNFQHVGKLPVKDGSFTITEKINKAQDKVFLNMTNNNSLLGAVDVALDGVKTTYDTLSYDITQPLPVTTTTQTNLVYFPNLLSNLNIKVVILNNGQGWGVLVGGPIAGASPRWCYSTKPYPNPLSEIVLVPGAVESSSEVVIIEGKPTFAFADVTPNGNIYIFAGDDVYGSSWTNTVTIADAKIAQNAYKYLSLSFFKGTAGICYQRGDISPTQSFDIILLVSIDAFKTHKTITVLELGFDQPSMCVNPVTGLVRIASHGSGKIAISTGESLDSIFTTTENIAYALPKPAVVYLGNLSNNVMGLFVQDPAVVTNSLYLSSDKFATPQTNILTVTALQATPSMKVIFATSKGMTRMYAWNNDAGNPLAKFVEKTDTSSTWTETTVSTTGLWNVGVAQVSSDLALVCTYGALQNAVPTTAPIVTQVLGEEAIQDMFYITSEF